MKKITEKRIDKMLLRSLFSEDGAVTFSDLKKYKKVFVDGDYTKQVIEEIPDLIKEFKCLIWYIPVAKGKVKLCWIDENYLKIDNYDLFKRFKKIEKSIIKEVTN
ncbi:MAG: hypothetical protein M0P94_05300 [Candidatus Absconditabacterales bacterium]|nr:hypothetical protein [Candidatus Absconditabacterales bacterium]